MKGDRCALAPNESVGLSRYFPVIDKLLKFHTARPIKGIVKRYFSPSTGGEIFSRDIHPPSPSPRVLGTYFRRAAAKVNGPVP